MATEYREKNLTVRAGLRRSVPYWPIIGGLLVLAALYLVGGSTYLLFHSLAEIFAIVISCAAFTLVWNSRRFFASNYLLIVGVALLAGSTINVAHLLAYKGMGVFAGESADLPTQLWIARRFLESLALLAAPFFMLKRFSAYTVLAMMIGLAALLIGLIFAGVFPAAYIEGSGLSSFKVISEYIIAGFFLAAAYALYRRREHFEPDVWPALVGALVLSSGAELLFTLYLEVYDLPNRLGHFLTIGAYFLIYLAIVKTGIDRPYTLLSTSNAALIRQAQWLNSLHEIDRGILQSKSSAEIAHETAHSLLAATNARRVSIVLFDLKSDRLVPLATAEDGREWSSDVLPAVYRLPAEDHGPQIGTIEDVAALPPGDDRREALLADGIRCYTSVPLILAEQAIGVILLGHAEPSALTDEVFSFVTQVAEQLAVAIRQAQLFDELSSSRAQLRTVSHRLVALQEEERKNLSRELHDRAGQSMTALQFSLGRVQRKLAALPDVQADLDGVRELATGVMEELHELAVSLRPVSLDRYGLVAALDQYVAAFRKQTQIEVDFLPVGLDEARLPEELETTLYRIAQEALTNITRHAHAAHVGITLERRRAAVTLIVEDDGCGFDVEQALRGSRLGLLGMRERVEMVGGTLTIESQPAHGTTVIVQLPVTA